MLRFPSTSSYRMTNNVLTTAIRTGIRSNNTTGTTIRCCIVQTYPSTKRNNNTIVRFSYRTVSSDTKKNGGQQQQQQQQQQQHNTNDENEETKEIVKLTPGETVVVVGRLLFWTGIGLFAGCCAYYIGKELIPTKMSPNRVFDRSLDIVRNDPDVKKRYGDTIKGYGRDRGGHREGRRNFIEHTEYIDPEDSSKRTRVRYNIEGRFGTAFVFAEVSSNMPSGEFVYVLVQDKSNGRVHTIIDNRAAITAKHLAGGDARAGEVMSQLLTGDRKQ